MSSSSSARSVVRPHVASFLGSLVLVAIGLLAGLGLAELPLRASSVTGGQRVGPAPTLAMTEAYRAYRVGEREDPAMIATATGMTTGDAYQAFRQGERSPLAADTALQAWLAFRAGERAVPLR